MGVGGVRGTMGGDRCEETEWPAGEEELLLSFLYQHTTTNICCSSINATPPTSLPPTHAASHYSLESTHMSVLGVQAIPKGKHLFPRLFITYEEVPSLNIGHCSP